MELLHLKDEGVMSVWAVREAEYGVAWNERQQAIDAARIDGRHLERTPIRLNPMPMWQRVTGLTHENEWRLRPFERRSALMRLARTVERMVRCEWKRVLDGPAETRDPFADDERDRDSAKCRYAERSELWNPVTEICFYMEIAQSKLSDLLRQATGLRAQDLSDCVRVEGLRQTLKENMRAAARAWMAKDGAAALAKLPAKDGATAVLKEYRSGETFLERSELAKSLGLGSRARLYRAVRLCERMELEALERAVAQEVFEELRPELAAMCEGSGGATVKEAAAEVKSSPETTETPLTD